MRFSDTAENEGDMEKWIHFPEAANPGNAVCRAWERYDPKRNFQ